MGSVPDDPLFHPSVLRRSNSRVAIIRWLRFSLDNSIIMERMSPYGCSDVTCRGKVTRLQGVCDVGTGRETITSELAAGVSFISSGRC